MVPYHPAEAIMLKANCFLGLSGMHGIHVLFIAFGILMQ